MSIEEALREHEERVDGLLKSATKYASTIKNWKKACQTGHIANLKKAASAAEDIVKHLEEPTREVAGSWEFDVREYLEGGGWRTELQDVCLSQFEMRVFEDQDTIVSPPILIKAQPGQSRLLFGSKGWPTIRPSYTGAHLKKLREKTSSLALSQQFLDAIYEGCKKYHPSDMSIRFAELYSHWSGAPGWKKENSSLAFAQRIYALTQSGIRTTTRDQKTFKIERPVGKYVKGDVYEVIGDDGNLERFYSIWFR